MTVIEHEAIETPVEPDPVLLRALEVVRAGWCQRSFTGPGGTRCLVGALISATTAPTSIHEVVQWIGFADVDKAIVWNDTPGRTKEEVMELLERKAYGL